MRSAFTQSEMAFLLGTPSGTRISRFERRRSVPDLKTVLAYQAIYGVPPHELFPGLFKEMRETVTTRAVELSEKLEAEPHTRRAPFKMDVLARIASLNVDAPQPHHEQKIQEQVH